MKGILQLATGAAFVTLIVAVVVPTPPSLSVAVRVTTVPAVYVPPTGDGWALIDPSPTVIDVSAYRGGPPVANAPKTDRPEPTPTVFTTAFVASSTDTFPASALTT